MFMRISRGCKQLCLTIAKNLQLQNPNNQHQSFLRLVRIRKHAILLILIYQRTQLRDWKSSYAIPKGKWLYCNSSLTDVFLWKFEENYSLENWAINYTFNGPWCYKAQNSFESWLQNIQVADIDTPDFRLWNFVPKS